MTRTLQIWEGYLNYGEIGAVHRHSSQGGPHKPSVLQNLNFVKHEYVGASRKFIVQRIMKFSVIVKIAMIVYHHDVLILRAVLLVALEGVTP